MSITTSNEYLNYEQMKGNAQYILDTLLAQGWTTQAICGMLGNLQTESTINSGIWESFNTNNMSGGFGLVQWTPATKLTDWLDSNGYAWPSIDGQLQRIIYEVNNGLQWIATTQYPMTFLEFIKSTDNVDVLAQVFITNYERPRDLPQPIRSDQAIYWFANLTVGPTTPITKKHKMPLYMYRLF